MLKQMLHCRGADLSVGQQQAIACALAFRPRVLILDEPTEGIQPSIVKDIGRVIRKLADQYLVMERGEVNASGSGSEMKAKNIQQLVAI